MTIISDYISGRRVRSTPEEIDAVQVISRILVEDLGYPKGYIQTHPQHRVRARPSDSNKPYPVDVCVFNSDAKSVSDEYIIVECKRRDRSDGLNQLKLYLKMSNASIGLLFNGQDRIVIQKIEEGGSIGFNELPSLPRFGQRVEDIGKFRKCDLRPTHNLKPIFRAIRNYLAGNNVGATKDEVLAEQIINIIFCKLFDEKNTGSDKIVKFRVGVNEPSKDVLNRILDLFSQVKAKYSDVLRGDSEITLDSKSVAHVVGSLQPYSLMRTDRDSIADAFEVFIGGALKGAQGQFFTPRNVIKMMVAFAKPCRDDTIIDPACGSGGFLAESLRMMWQDIEKFGKERDWSEENIFEEKLEVAIKNIHGIDKDNFLAKVAKTYMAILGDGKGGVFTDDALEVPGKWRAETKRGVALGKYDLVLTNPPFGKNITVMGEDKLFQYDLAKKWKKIDEGGGVQNMCNRQCYEIKRRHSYYS